MRALRVCITLAATAFFALGNAFAAPDLPIKDVSEFDGAQQVVIAQGTKTVYQGHPTSVLFPDGKTILCVWTVGHGGHAGPAALSSDGGKTWTRVDERFPAEYQTHVNCPSVYRLVNADGKAFVWVFSAQPKIARVVSSDEGKTWRVMPSLGFSNVMAFSSVVPKNPGVQDGCYIGLFHHCVNLDTGAVLNGESCKNRHLEVLQSETSDAGFTWSTPRVVASVDGKDACEPCAFWSPDGKELCCLMRENKGTGGEKKRALQMFSQDGGRTWSEPEPTCWGLTGHRHVAAYLPDGRLIVVFRDTAPDSPTLGSFVAWVGTYDDIKSGKPGQFRIKLIQSYAGWDCGYPGLHVLPDGTILAITYIKYQPGEDKQSVVGVRFKLGQISN
ncbi:MAG: exo-alpha-sialidase [Thermoguttaceae bacterium]|nr:exo-alpha-sialidase [Thermoguttaceae bacterium]